MIDMPIPASPQNSSSLTIGNVSPDGSAQNWAMPSKPYSPIFAASWISGQGVSSRSSHSAAAGRTTFAAKPWTHSRTSSWSCESSSENAPWLKGSVTASIGSLAIGSERYEANRPVSCGRERPDEAELMTLVQVPRLPREAHVLAPHLPALAEEIVAAIAADVPEYARPLARGSDAVRHGVHSALAEFVELARGGAVGRGAVALDL